jgi:glutaconyl-CoA/methylmalonyl-CoA decarboxylase subunit delta
MGFEKLFGKKTAPAASISKDNGEIPSADVVAISMALHLFYDEVHDNESNVITIKRIERRYSPWSSKIYGVTNNLR